MSLVAELKKEVVGGEIVSTEFYKKQRAAYFFIKKEKLRRALGFVYHPAGYGVFVVPASKIKVDTREKPWPIFKLEGAIVRDVKQLGFDRIFQVFLERDGQRSSILIEALGPNGNIWLLDCHRTKLATLRNRRFNEGDKYEPPLMPVKLQPSGMSRQSIKEHIGHEGKGSLPLLLFVERNILGFNRTLAHELITRAGERGVEVQSLDDHSLDAIIVTVKDIVSRFARPEVGYLYHVDDKVEVYPFKLSSALHQPEKYKSLSLATLAMTCVRRTQVAAENEEKRIKDVVTRAWKRLERRAAKIRHDIRDASDYEQYKRIGELLQISFGKIKKGMTELNLEDVYTEPHTEITIALNPTLSPAKNVEFYFKRFRKGREGLQLVQRRLLITEEEQKRLLVIQSELDEDFASARARDAPEIVSLLPKERTKRQTLPRLPYREYALTSGVKVFVGRGGADNDRTTFEFARPYELWFHTQQCPGSHVVMKYPNKSFEPSQSEIDQAAAIAAYFSKAKNDSLVPVTYTQKRYIRKPRKAKAGLVTVEREKSVMVAPQKPSRTM